MINKCGFADYKKYEMLARYRANGVLILDENRVFYCLDISTFNNANIINKVPHNG